MADELAPDGGWSVELFIDGRGDDRIRRVQRTVDRTGDERVAVDVFGPAESSDTIRRTSTRAGRSKTPSAGTPTRIRSCSRASARSLSASAWSGRPK